MLEPWVISYIKNVAKEELKDKNENVLKSSWDTLDLIFQLWKLECGRAIYEKRLIDLCSLSTYKKESTIKFFADLAPWECAGLKFPSRIRLAFKLHDENYPEYMAFRKITNDAGIFALLVDKETGHCSDTDWFAAYAVIENFRSRRSMFSESKTLAEYRNQQPLIEAGRIQKQNLKKGNPAAAKNKSTRAQTYRQLWIKWAIEIMSGAPWMTASQVLDKVFLLAEKDDHKMANGHPYSRRTISNVLRSVKGSFRIQE